MTIRPSQKRSKMSLSQHINDGKKASQKQEEGIALVIALLTGMLLIVGTTGLLIRQLTARKLGATESYQQMAETAASNGFNRILSTLNDASGTYRGYLFTVDNWDQSTPQWKWSQRYLGDQVCAGTSLPAIADQDGNTTNWPAGNYYALSQATDTLKDDGVGNVQTFYRLRSFETDYTEGQGSGTFEVEGTVIRQNSTTNSKEIVARALLTRTLAIDSRVPNWDDWSVLATVGFQNGSAINITGGGLFSPIITPLSNSTTANQVTSLCSDTTYNVSSSVTTPVVWPIVNPAGKVELPSTDIYDKNKAIDKVAGKRRVWTFNDSDDEGIQACGNRLSVYCTRPEDSYSYPNGQLISGVNVVSNAIGTIPGTSIKTWRINDGQYEIGTYQEPIYPSDFSNASINEIHPGGSRFDASDWTWEAVNLNASDIKLFYVDDTTGLPYIAYCINSSRQYCEPDDLIERPWEQKLERFKFEKISGINYSHKILIPASTICSNNSSAKSCHIYLENLNLSETEVFIENENQPVVLHLGDSGIVRRNDMQSNYKYELDSGSQLCGTNTASPNNCNNQAHRLVITANSSNNPGSCTLSSSNDFTVSGSSLPAAWISLTNDRVNLKNATIKGTIWADSVCNSGITSLTTTDGSKQYVESAAELWEWESIGFYGIGKRMIRGIRGSEYDIFRIW